MGTIWMLATSMRFWLGMGIVSLTLYGGVMNVRLNHAKSELKQMQTILTQERAAWKLEKEFALQVAEKMRINYEHAAEKAKTEFTLLVGQAESNAYKNYVARFGSPFRPVASNIGISGVRFPTSTITTGTSEVQGSKGDDGVHEREPVPAPDSKFIGICAKDAGMIEVWKQLCISAQCEVVE